MTDGEKQRLANLIKRISARAFDGRFYHFEDEDRELAIKFLKQLKLDYSYINV